MSYPIECDLWWMHEERKARVKSIRKTQQHHTYISVVCQTAPRQKYNHLHSNFNAGIHTRIRIR